MNPGTRAIVACCCLSLLCILAYGRSLTAPFVWDDDTLIVQNPALGSARFFLDAFSTVYWRQGPFPEDYRPFEAWSYGIDSLIWPDNPLGFHISNLLIHIINCVILYFLFRRVTGSERCALLGGVLFALHPIHSEAVIWVQNRSELLAAAFILISLCACLRYLRNDGRGTRWYALCLGTCSCAALTKESALILPLLAAALLPFSGGTTARRRSCVGGLVIVAAACAAIKLGIAIWSPLPALSLPPVYGTLKHLYAVVRTAWCYLGMLALPMNFSIDRYFVPPVPPYPIGYSCAAAALLLCLAITLLAYRAHRTPGLAAAILLIALIPVANIIYIAGRPLSEGRCYVPSMGFCLLAASAIEGLRRIRPSKRLPLLIAAALATAYLLITLMRAETWRNEKVLWERTTEVSPSSWKAKLFLAKIYREEGRYDEAVSLLKRILRTVTPRPPMACVDLGRVYDEIGWYPHAREAYERAVAADPLYLTARLCLGDAYLREQRYDEALAQYSFIEGTWPRRGNGQLKIALVYRARGERQKTIAKLNEFLAIHPGDTLGTITLAGVLADSGDSAGAERLFRDALRNNPSSAIPLNNYGLFLEGRGRTAEAIAIFSRASEVSPREAAPHFNLARIHEREGRPGEALIAMMRAAERKPGEARYLEEINRISGRVGEVDIPAPLVAAIDAGHRALLAARGIYCSRIGDGGGAEECFKKLVALRPSDGAARANLGRIYADRGEYTMALRELLRAADLLPGEASVHTSLGFCYEKLGRRTDALREWERARALDPMAKEPRRNIARIRGGG